MSKSLELYDSIDIHSSVPVYAQIENVVRFAIASGKLDPGDKLPPSKTLADRLDVNFNTVFKAYRTLEVMGLIYTRRGMGVFIEKDAQKKCLERIRTEVIVRLHEVTSEGKAAGMSSAEFKTALKACLASDVKPYGPVPQKLLALAKKK